MRQLAVLRVSHPPVTAVGAFWDVVSYNTSQLPGICWPPQQSLFMSVESLACPSCCAAAGLLPTTSPAWRSEAVHQLVPHASLRSRRGCRSACSIGKVRGFCLLSPACQLVCNRYELVFVWVVTRQLPTWQCIADMTNLQFDGRLWC